MHTKQHWNEFVLSKRITVLHRRLVKPVKHLLCCSLVLLACGALSSCSTAKKSTVDRNDYPALEERDPFENYNRKMFAFNQKVDKTILAPAARRYRRIVPGPVRTGVHNFFLNLEEPVTIVNDVLQGKFLQAGKDTTRFLLNSTLGLAGLVDIASDLNLEKHDEDFGQTFAVWGFGSGPHIELPFLGPSNLRDGIGLVGEVVYLDPIYALDRTTAEYALTAVEIIDVRVRFLGTEKVLDQQLDPYLFIRDGYRQRRRNLIYDGNPPLEEDVFFDESELFEDDDKSQ